ncbi:hypothetical protein BDQ17DRAFT_1392198 [Cyathus striatus]|nr:hypothetical protein BDQ17DRAFT_1392198 [Cyathus striatus]
MDLGLEILLKYIAYQIILHKQDILLSPLQKFQQRDLSPHSPHLFTLGTEEYSAQLQDLLQTADQVSHSLQSYLSVSWSNPKLISLLRQHIGIANTCKSQLNVEHIVSLLHARAGILYGENIPFERNAIPEWCVAQLEAWGKLVGMEAFKDIREGFITVALGGKVLVVDFDFALDTAQLTVKVASVKTSYALSYNGVGSTSNASGSTSLNSFLAETIQQFCLEAQRSEDKRNPEHAASIKENIIQQLQYLVMLDNLANRKSSDGGIRWFVDIDQLCPILENFARSEAEVVASTLGVGFAPLDIYLTRSHGLPLPYFLSPSISFLTYLSPSAYINLLRDCNTPETDTSLPKLDVDLSTLRSHLLKQPKGSIIATLMLIPHSHSQFFPSVMSIPNLNSRPTFPLVPMGSEFEHVFPHLEGLSIEESTSYEWVLDFTGGGSYPGVVMSQSRMRDIELVVNPLSGMDDLNAVSMMSFGGGSWVDLLLSPGNEPSERYTALFRSPGLKHPPLQLCLNVPGEPGFILERVPVHSMKEVWGILEVVKEQSWLNEVLASCSWSKETVKSLEQDNTCSDATEEELHAVMSGTFTPQKIPVNVFLPSTSGPSEAQALFGSELDIQPRRPKIFMTSPERLPITGMVEITVSYDESKPRGVSVEVMGAMGADIKGDVLEEVCRRGGTLGLPGRIWSSAPSLSL